MNDVTFVNNYLFTFTCAFLGVGLLACWIWVWKTVGEGNRQPTRALRYQAAALKIVAEVAILVTIIRLIRGV